MDSVIGLSESIRTRTGAMLLRTISLNHIQVKLNQLFVDRLELQDKLLKEWLDGLHNVECPQSLDKTCANFDCHSNYRLLHKLVVNGDVK